MFSLEWCISRIAMLFNILNTLDGFKRTSLMRILGAGMILFAAPAYPFGIGGQGHLQITNEALTPISRTVDNETLRFTQRALSQIRFANGLVDANQGNASLHFDNETLDGGSGRLVNLKNEIIGELLAAESDGSKARRNLGSALHTIQDFFAHTNTVERGFGSPDFGVTVLRRPAITVRACAADFITVLPGGALTSGYFPTCSPTPGKCRHGTPILCNSGIAKDDDSHPLHGAAQGLATAASAAFVNSILDDPSIAGNARAIKRLMDIRPTLGVIIDDSGSMQPVIDQIKGSVAQIVTSVRGTRNEPDQYLLQTFNDPTVGATLTFNESGPFLAAVNRVSAGGGGDCPELAWTGTFLAANKALSDSTLFVFTDASAKDTNLAGNTSALATKKRIKINPILFGSCSPFDQAYFDVAQNTGGQVFVLAMSETSDILRLLAPLIQTDSHAIFTARTTQTLSGVSYDVLVDDTISEVTFSVSTPTKGTITLVRPDGSPVVLGQPNVNLVDLTGGRVYTIKSPPSGTWRLTATGNGGEVSLSVNGLTTLFLNKVEYAELKGRTGHEALYPIDGSPITGQLTSIVAELFGTFSTATYEIRNPAGTLLQILNLERGNPNADPDAFVGNFTPPSEPYLVYVKGITSGGISYQRVLPGEVLASVVEVFSPLELPSVIAGRSTELGFRITNFGAPGDFRFVGADDKSFLTGITSGTLSLATGESTRVALVVQPSATTPPFTLFNLTLNVERVDNPRVTNSATLLLETAPANSQPNCAAATPSIATLRPNHKFVNINIRNVTDPDADPVTITITGITQDEPVDGKADGHTAPDGGGVGTPNALIRAERSGKGDGRVYAISFSADDGRGGACQGVVNVGVPKKERRAVIDSGQRFDSTIIPPGFEREDNDDKEEDDD